ncbi:MAG TPA: MFS transporter, partial [Actinomycetes bacterium]|nr:MFS transporter [Actinomycetes bacterium]
PFVALEGATLLSGLGNGVAMVALPWLVLDLTGSAGAAGLVAGVTALPLLLSSLFSGTIVDRLGRRRTSVVSDLFSAAAVAAIPVVDLTIGLTFAWVLVLAALGAVFDPAGVTARESMLTGVASATGMRQEQVNGLHEAVWGAAFVVGPGIGAVLIATVGAVGAMWVMAAGFIASALLLFYVHVPGAGRPERQDRPAFWSGTRDGLRQVFNDPVLRAVTLVSTAVVAVAYPVLGVVLPVIFQAADEPARLGFVVMSFSLGGVAGALAYSRFGHRSHPRRAFLLSVCGAAGTLVLFAVAPTFGVMVGAALVGGALIGPMNPVINLALQRRTSEQMRGRAMGVVVALAYGAYPLGYLLAGGLVEWLGTDGALFVFAAISLAVAILAVRIRSLRRLDEAEVTASSVVQVA